MKLSKNCKSILDTIISLKPDLAGIYYTVRYIAENFEGTMEYDEYRGVLDTLAELHAIRWGDEQRTAFSLTERGRAYKEIDRLEARERWKERAFGFAAGVVSSLLVAFIINIAGL